MMDTAFEYVFPAIRGIQAGREYYVSMCPLKLIPKIFTFDDCELLPELRAQRILNQSRIPIIAQYIVQNKDDYVFSAITASIDGTVKFEAIGDDNHVSRVGKLKIDMNSQFIINDGQHRRAAIAEALKDEPGLRDESISVVFFVDRGLHRCQQMFADLNRYSIRPSKSLGLLYDHRDDRAQIAKMVALMSTTFGELVEMEKTSLSERSRRLFTLSAIHSANNALLSGKEIQTTEGAAQLAIEFWDELGKHIHEWTLVRESKIKSGEVRTDYVHAHANVLQAFGVVGNCLLSLPRAERSKRLKLLGTINWRRSNVRAWEGRAMLGGRMQKASNNVTLTANLIKHKLGIELSAEEQIVEEAYKRGEHA